MKHPVALCLGVHSLLTVIAHSQENPSVTSNKWEINNVSYSGRLGCGGEKFSNPKLGLTPNVTLPFAFDAVEDLEKQGAGSEIRLEVSRFSFDANYLLKNVAVSTFEADWLLEVNPAGRLGYAFVRGGLNANYLSGIPEVNPSDEYLQYDKAYGSAQNNPLRFGFGLNIGAGMYVLRSLGIHAEYSTGGIFVENGIAGVVLS